MTPNEVRKRGPYAGLTEAEVAEWRTIRRWHDTASEPLAYAWRDFKDSLEIRRREQRRETERDRTNYDEPREETASPTCRTRYVPQIE
jgi:hypothetical protein